MIRTRADLPALLNWLNLTGFGAEIGVFRGEHAFSILETWKGKNLFLVDCWRRQSETVYHDIHNLTDEQWEEVFNNAVTRLDKHKTRVSWMKTFSIEASRLFANESLDFVYIDANHKQDAVMADLSYWYPKVRKGGIMAGHDYLHRVTPECTIEVKPAVDEFFKHQRIHVTDEDFPTWMVVRP